MYCHQLLAFAFSLLPLVGTASSACFWPRFFCCLLETASSLQSAFTAAALDAIRIRFRLHLPQQLLMHLHPLFLPAISAAALSMPSASAYILASDYGMQSMHLFVGTTSSPPSIIHPPSLQFDCHQRPWTCISFEALALNGSSALAIELSHLLPLCTLDCNHQDSTEHISFELWLRG
jgi:hypothetical protein